MTPTNLDMLAMSNSTLLTTAGLPGVCVCCARGLRVYDTVCWFPDSHTHCSVFSRQIQQNSKAWRPAWLTHSTHCRIHSVLRNVHGAHKWPFVS